MTNPPPPSSVPFSHSFKHRPLKNRYLINFQKNPIYEKNNFAIFNLFKRFFLKKRFIYVLRESDRYGTTYEKGERESLAAA